MLEELLVTWPAVAVLLAVALLEMEYGKHNAPNTDRLDPRLTKEFTDIVDPKLAQPTTDRADPS